MELKQHTTGDKADSAALLIVPYGIETKHIGVNGIGLDVF